MNVVVKKDAESAYQYSAELIAAQVQLKAKSKLGLATGGTAEGIYEQLLKIASSRELSFKQVQTVNLDEYRDLDPENEQSYRASMNRWLFEPLGIPLENTYVASGLGDADDACRALTARLDELYPVDLQLLGVGCNGHIAFNEPGDFLQSGPHIQKLDEDTVEVNSRFFDKLEDVPRYAITMGMGDILSASKILIVATGTNKADAMRALLCDDKVDCNCPVTFLKLHSNVTVVMDQGLADAVYGQQAAT